MPLSEDQLNTIRAIFLESLNEHFPDAVRFTEAHVRNACTRCVDEYVRVNAIYESEQPELSPTTLNRSPLKCAISSAPACPPVAINLNRLRIASSKVAGSR